MPDIPMTEQRCDQVRHSCADQVKERYESIRSMFAERFTHVIDTIKTSDRERITSLEAGAVRMSEIEADLISLETRTEADIRDLNKGLKEAVEPNWTMLGIIVTVAVTAMFTIGGALLATWKQVGVQEVQFANMKEQVVELKTSVTKQNNEVLEAMRDLRSHMGAR